MAGDKNINEYVKKVNDALREQADSENAIKQKEYMKNKFEFFGLKAQTRRKITRKFNRKENRPDYDQLESVITKVWEKPEREFQYFGTELLERFQKQFKEDIVDLFEFMIIHKSWWDTIDRISKKLVGEYFKVFPDKVEPYIEKWLASENIWLQRTCLLFQLGYKEETDLDLLFRIVEELNEIDEFFIQKAIGWSLREYSKVEPEVIKEFIKKHDLSSLATREGMKIIKKK